MPDNRSAEQAAAHIARIEEQFALGYAYLGQSEDGNHQGDAADIRFLLDEIAFWKTEIEKANEAIEMLGGHPLTYE